MNGNRAVESDFDGAERLGRIVIIGMAIIEAIIMVLAYFSKSHHGLV